MLTPSLTETQHAKRKVSEKIPHNSGMANKTEYLYLSKYLALSIKLNFTVSKQLIAEVWRLNRAKVLKSEGEAEETSHCSPNFVQLKITEGCRSQ